MKVLISSLMIATAIAPLICAQEVSASPSEEAKTNPEVPKQYEVGEDTVSPDGRFAVLFPVRNEASDQENGPPYPPNLLVRLKPYTILTKVRNTGLPNGWRDKLLAEWNGSMVVAIYVEAKWGIADLSVYEIDNDKLKRVHPIFKEARKYFDRDFHKRFLKKYPKEYDHYTFVGNEEVPDFEFKGRKVTVYLLAENKPNVAPGPIWSAELNGVWNLDTATFEKVDFKPGEISVRKPEE